MLTKGLITSNSNEWETPMDLFQELDREFHFDLDPCSTDENAKCEFHYTIDNDGLTQNWGGGESSATLRMAVKYTSGFANVAKNPRSPERLSSC